MTWFKVDDRLWSHPKWFHLPIEAKALWVSAGSYCAQHETDGVISRQTLAIVLPNSRQTRAAMALVDAGLWEQDGDTFRFHDWDEFQPTKRQLDAERQQAKERMRALRNKRRSGNVRANNKRTSPEVREPRPDPTRPIEVDKSTSIYDAHFARFWETFPNERKRAKPDCQKLFTQAVKEGTNPDTIIQAAERYRDDPNREPEYTVNPKTWLREQRWESGPLPARSSTADRSLQALQRDRQRITNQTEPPRLQVASYPWENQC